MSKSKEEIIQRTLSTANMSDFIHEDLSDFVTMVTPKDVKLFPRLGRKRATASLHEWRERELMAPSASGVYDGETAVPTSRSNSGVARDNKVTQIGHVAVATEFLNAMNTVGKGAWETEFEEKMVNTLRDIEHQIFHGDRSVTAPQQMDGLIAQASNFNQVSNAGSAAALVETKLHEAIIACYEQGGNPDWILATPTVAQRIANFNADKIRFTPGGGPGGVTNGTFTYLSPFGDALEVIPVRQSFLPSGTVYLLDSSKMSLAFLSNGIELKDIPIQGDEVARKLIKAYLTLELRAYAHHACILNVSNSL